MIGVRVSMMAFWPIASGAITLRDAITKSYQTYEPVKGADLHARLPETNLECLDISGEPRP
jgi:hypothetical protein